MIRFSRIYEREGALARVASLALLMAVAAGCAAGYDDADPIGPGAGPNADDDSSNNGAFNNDDGGANGDPFIPEEEIDYTFSQPAVVGERVFVANETLNSVVVINSTTLGISTIPVGFGPTEVVGPRAPGAEGARVFVLNQGSSSVTILEPDTDGSQTVPVTPRANRLVGNVDGTAAVAWYDEDAAEPGTPAGDLSSVTLIRQGQAHEVAVGFNVREVFWDEAGERALVISDDGVSVLEAAAIDADRAAPPVAALPPQMAPLDPRDLEVQVDASGEYVIARLATFAGVVLTELATGERHVVYLGEVPTDIDLVEKDELEVLIMLRRARVMVRATVPEGLIRAAAATAPPEQSMAMDMGSIGGADMGAGPTGDMGAAPADMGAMLEMGSADMSAALEMGSADMSAAPEMGSADMGSTDMSSADMDAADMGAMLEMGSADMGSPDMGSPDMATPPEGFELDAEGVIVEPLLEDIQLGAAAVSGDGTQAMLYTTIGEVRRVILYDLRDQDRRVVALEKGVLGILPGELGATFLVFHTRVEGAPPQDASPSDPAFVARSWGLSVVDVATGAARLVLTELEPRRATLWRAEGATPRAYVIFAQPRTRALEVPAHRDVLRVDLQTFSVDSFRVPSLPTSIGAIPDAARVYVDQVHPQGRMTFVDVLTGRRQTVTGYQLNAGID